MTVIEIHTLAFGDNGCQVYFSGEKYMILNPYHNVDGKRYGTCWSLFSMPECLLIQEPNNPEHYLADTSLETLVEITQSKLGIQIDLVGAPEDLPGTYTLFDAAAHQPSRVETIHQELRYFTGTEEWHRHRGLFRLPIFLTDGAKFVAEKCGPDDTHGAYWLMDVIASYQGEKCLARHEFQTWKLVIHLPDESNASRRATVTCFDGNKQLVRQEIEHTDFILDDGITLYASVEGNPCSLIILLPSEY